MLRTIQEASENFCIHQIRLQPTLHVGVSKKIVLIAYIDINAQDSKTHRVYIASEKAFMQRVSKVFLEEDESDEETLIDMTLETANLIVGSAKVIAQEESSHLYTINTPYFEKIGTFDYEFDTAQTLNIEDDELTIAIKELHV